MGKIMSNLLSIPIIDPARAATNERLARLEAIAEQHTQTLNRLEDHITRVEDHMHKAFRWLIGLMFIAWISTIVTILLKVD